MQETELLRRACAAAVLLQPLVKSCHNTALLPEWLGSTDCSPLAMERDESTAGLTGREGRTGDWEEPSCRLNKEPYKLLK